jgi:hypothetical protein
MDTKMLRNFVSSQLRQTISAERGGSDFIGGAFFVNGRVLIRSQLSHGCASW